MDATKEMKGQTGMSPVAGSGASHRGGWVKQLRGKLDELLNLPEGWDGPGSGAVLPEVAEFSTKMLDELYHESVPAPSLVPGGDGSMQLEWHCGGYDIELHVHAPNEVDAWRDNRKLGVDDEILIKDDFTVIIGWLDELGRALQAKKGGHSDHAA